MPDKKGSDDRAYARGFAAGRAAATPDPPDPYGPRCEAGRICCRGMGADGGCNICAAEATR